MIHWLQPLQLLEIWMVLSGNQSVLSAIMQQAQNKIPKVIQKVISTKISPFYLYYPKGGEQYDKSITLDPDTS